MFFMMNRWRCISTKEHNDCLNV